VDRRFPEKKGLPGKKFAEVSPKNGDLGVDLQSFTHSVSHYMKAPITAILGFSSLLQEELVRIEHTIKKVHIRSEISHYSDRITENARLLEKMINDLVFTLRLKKGKAELIKIEEVCRDVINSLGNLFHKKNISVEVEKDMPPALAGREHLHYILSELLGNAAQFSREKSTIFIGFNNGEYFVRDEGIGISSEILDRVFTIFFTTRGKKSMCTGTGLYIVKRIVELYDGIIRIESMPNRGTTVFFSFFA